MHTFTQNMHGWLAMPLKELKLTWLYILGVTENDNVLDSSFSEIKF